MNQFFKCFYSGNTYLFETCVNGAGYYSEENNTILGTLYSQDGKRISTLRIDYRCITPLQPHQIKLIFPNR